MKYKKIFKEDGRYVISEDVFIYEILGSTSRKLQPTFESRFWEVYALHRENGLYYTIIGKHHDVREFYKKEIIFSRAGRFWLPIGRDLAVKTMGDVHWEILTRKDGHLVSCTDKFLPFKNCIIASVNYHSPVIATIIKSPNGAQYEGKMFWKQEPNGYASIEEKDTAFLIEGYAALPDDPLFI